MRRRFALYVPEAPAPRRAGCAQIWGAGFDVLMPNLPAPVPGLHPGRWRDGAVLAARFRADDAGRRRPVLLRLDVLERVAAELGYLTRCALRRLLPEILGRFGIKARLWPRPRGTRLPAHPLRAPARGSTRPGAADHGGLGAPGPSATPQPPATRPWPAARGRRPMVLPPAEGAEANRGPRREGPRRDRPNRNGGPRPAPAGAPPAEGTRRGRTPPGCPPAGRPQTAPAPRRRLPQGWPAQGWPRRDGGPGLRRPAAAAQGRTAAGTATV